MASRLEKIQMGTRQDGPLTQCLGYQHAEADLDCIVFSDTSSTKEDELGRVRNPSNSAVYKLNESNGARLLWLQVSSSSHKYVDY